MKSIFSRKASQTEITSSSNTYLLKVILSSLAEAGKVFEIEFIARRYGTCLLLALPAAQVGLAIQTIPSSNGIQNRFTCFLTRKYLSVELHRVELLVFNAIRRTASI